MANPIFRDGQSTWWRIRLGIADLLTSRQETSQPVGCGSYLLFGRSKPDSRSRYVRAFLPYGLRRESGGIRRCLHAEHQLGKRLSSLSQPRTRLELVATYCERGRGLWNEPILKKTGKKSYQVS